MASTEITPVDHLIEHIKFKRNFVLQGGAGSGKTETLKNVVKLITEEKNYKKVACITHTNKAADEISDRILGTSKVSTIHAFLSELILPFRKNIKSVFPSLFTLPPFEATEIDTHKDEKSWRLAEHNRFKKLHGKLTSRRWIVLTEETNKVTGKPQFDNNPELYIAELNGQIAEINQEITSKIASYDPSDIFYNETSAFNNIQGGYGHDGLIEIATMLFDHYPLLGKILSDRFDCVFIDEFQDTNPDVIRALIDVSMKNDVLIGLFGDSEQAIYEGGIGNVQQYISSNALELVQKIDNYRCSPQVIKVANSFRCDELDQEVALKKLDDGSFETYESRQGSAKFYFALAPQMQDDRQQHKENCIQARDKLVELVSKQHNNFVQLKLTNKAIAFDARFGNLWSIFSDRYSETRELMKKTLDRMQFRQVVDLINLFHIIDKDKRSYNRLISQLRKRGFKISAVEDKARLERILKKISEGGMGAYQTIEYALENGLIAQTDSHKALIYKRKSSLSEFTSDLYMSDFESFYNDGHNTKKRMLAALGKVESPNLSIAQVESNFDKMKYRLQEKIFLLNLFSNNLKFSEIKAFYQYEEEDGDGFATMHKTKGTGIENVIVVLDEYAWNQKYNFLSCFSGSPPESIKEIQTRKLLYVACSRTKKNLICLRLVADEEEAIRIAAFFPESEEIIL